MNINFAWLTDAFRTPDLRRKILFTLGMLALYRLGTTIPTPGVDYPAIQQCVELVQGDSLYGVINLFSGGALLQLSVFALGIMPYITAVSYTNLTLPTNREGMISVVECYLKNKQKKRIREEE